MKKRSLTYRIFYWVPNTLSGERIAIGMCLFDKETKRLKTLWISQSDLSRIQKIFSFSSKADSRDVLSLMHEAEGSWKSKAFDPSFWHYIERYWNGIVKVSDARKMVYDGTKQDFEEKSKILADQFLPLSQTVEKKKPGPARSITKNFEKEVVKREIQHKVSLGQKIPEHGNYHLLKPIYLDLAARNGDIVGSAGFDLSLKTDTLAGKAHSYFEGFQKIKKAEGGANFNFVLHKRGKGIIDFSELDSQFYDDFMYRCDDLNIRVWQMNELPELIDEISEMPRLRPFEIESE